MGRIAMFIIALGAVFAVAFAAGRAVDATPPGSGASTTEQAGHA